MELIKRLGVTEESIQQIVQDHLTTKATPWTKPIQIGHIAIEPFSACPEGFLADHYMLKVKFQSGSIEEELQFFVKCSPVDKQLLAQYLTEIGSFKKETSVLRDILPALRVYCPSRQLAPTVHLAHEQRLIVMQNLKSNGYEVVKVKCGILSEPFLRQALKTLACLHASSIVHEEKCKTSLLELFPDVLTENAWINSPTSTRTKDVENVITLYKTFVHLCDHLSAERKEAIVLQIPTLLRSIYEFVKPSNKFRNCLNHGDLWCNNLMFKMDATNNPTDCILVDYQMSRYAPPGYDINLLLYLISSSPCRAQSRQTLLSYYYECFVEVLDEHGIDAQHIYSKDNFLTCCEYYRLAGLIHASIISPEVTLPSSFLELIFESNELTAGFMPDSKINICVKAFETDNTYRDHIVELMDELFTFIA
ncbi:uncharacterized protein LOC126575963 [Anopheles aquasalis]|uniref:uncharacterized protein LOC126575963 n=1 Tax=Anopheles aquasalis TaxID=42839 RepID=UPI00215B5DD2|nr:uncharacterized protein LOC126575963 [Anopheles aquasalis]